MRVEDRQARAAWVGRRVVGGRDGPSGRRTLRPRSRSPVNACGLVTSWTRWRSIARTAGAPGSCATTWSSQIFSTSVRGLVIAADALLRLRRTGKGISAARRVAPRHPRSSDRTRQAGTTRIRRSRRGRHRGGRDRRCAAGGRTRRPPRVARVRRTTSSRSIRGSSPSRGQRVQLAGSRPSRAPSHQLLHAGACTGARRQRRLDAASCRRRHRSSHGSVGAPRPRVRLPSRMKRPRSDSRIAPGAGPE